MGKEYEPIIGTKEEALASFNKAQEERKVITARENLIYKAAEIYVNDLSDYSKENFGNNFTERNRMEMMFQIVVGWMAEGIDKDFLKGIVEYDTNKKQEKKLLDVVLNQKEK